MEERKRNEVSPIPWWKVAFKGSLPQDAVDVIEMLFILPPSTASIERKFSTLGNIMTKQRNRLSIEKAEKLCTIVNFYKLLNRESAPTTSQEPSGRKRKFPEA